MDQPQSQDGGALPMRPNRNRTRIVRLRNKGWPIKSIAKRLGLTERNVAYHLSVARQAGALLDHAQFMDLFVIPASLDAVHRAVTSDDLKLASDKGVRILEGREVLSRHVKHEGGGPPGAGSPMMSFTLKIEQPPGMTIRAPETLIGQVVGVPLSAIEAPYATETETALPHEGADDAARQFGAGTPAHVEATGILRDARERPEPARDAIGDASVERP